LGDAQFAAAALADVERAVDGPGGAGTGDEHAAVAGNEPGDAECTLQHGAGADGAVATLERGTGQHFQRSLAGIADHEPAHVHLRTGGQAKGRLTWLKPGAELQ